MHVNCYEISVKSPVDREEFLTVDWAADYAEALGFDYAEEVDDEVEKEALEMFPTIFPNGMFTLVGERAFRYNGGFAEWEKAYAERIKELAAALPEEDVLRSEEYSKMNQYIRNPFGTVVFYDEDKSTYQKEVAFMRSVVRGLQEGDVLHIGGIVSFVS